MCSVAQSCLTLSDPMDCSPPGSSVHGILHERILEWVACPPPPRDFPHPGIKPGYSALQVDSLPLSPQGRPVRWLSCCLSIRQQEVRMMLVHKVGDWWHLIRASSPPVYTPHGFSLGCWIHFINSLSGVAHLNISHVWRISTVFIQVCSVQTYILLLSDCTLALVEQLRRHIRLWAPSKGLKCPATIEASTFIEGTDSSRTLVWAFMSYDWSRVWNPSNCRIRQTLDPFPTLRALVEFPECIPHCSPITRSKGNFHSDRLALGDLFGGWRSSLSMFTWALEYMDICHRPKQRTAG